ncbi:MAG: NfeD family protein [Gemmatimonadota bacterium]|nr:NfeD family protein [Gemmatimonadota bacterium]
MDWWIWIIGGVALCLMELLTPGVFFLLFFGAGAIVVGILTWTGLLETAWVQVLLLSIFSLGALVLFRRTLLDKLTNEKSEGRVTTITDQVCTALENIPPGGTGQAEMRGSGWSAHNEGDEPIEKDQQCTVERVEGISLRVRGK